MTGFSLSFRRFLPVAVPFAVLMVFQSTPAAANCFSHYIDNDGTTSPTIVLVNQCDEKVYYNLCTVKSGDFRNFFPGYTAPGGRSRHTLWLKNGQTYRFNYNWKTGNYPSAPSC